MRVVVGLATVLGASVALARTQYLVNELSFGHNQRISPESNGQVPNFHLQGHVHMPEILSNKIVLTPVAPGNQRGAIWGDRQLQHSQWQADIDFRATGPERGGGNINIWLVRGGGNDVGANSIYTVGRFDGLGLVIDTYAGSAGMIRGFLNDGTVDYSQLHSIDDKAFGHCFYAYRNLGRPSQIKLYQSENSFRVDIDDRLCFESDKIKIPPGYQFGISAATPDNPDSVEIFKLVVMSESLQPGQAPPPAQNEKPAEPMQGQQQQSGQGQSQGQGQPPGKADDPYDSAIPDQNPDMITSSKSQFADLHNRLQSVNHHISTIFRTSAKHAQMDERRHAEVSKLLDDVKVQLSALGIGDLRQKVDSLEREIRALRTELAGQVRNSEHALKGLMSDHHANLADGIASNAPRGHGRLIAVIVGSQVVLGVGYVLYKRKLKSSPKKYL